MEQGRKATLFEGNFLKGKNRKIDGGPTRGRTWDHPVMSRGLYQLSYGPASGELDLLCAGAIPCQEALARIFLT